jgi:hypothetical protein
VEKTCAFCPEEPEGAVVALSTVQRIAQNTTGDSDSEESERDAALSNSVSEESEHAAALSDSDSEESERDVALSTVAIFFRGEAFRWDGRVEFRPIACLQYLHRSREATRRHGLLRPRVLLVRHQSLGAGAKHVPLVPEGVRLPQSHSACPSRLRDGQPHSGAVPLASGTSRGSSSSSPHPGVGPNRHDPGGPRRILGGRRCGLRPPDRRGCGSAGLTLIRTRS